MASKKQKQKKKNHTCHIMNYRFVFGLVHLICLGCTSTAALDMEGVEKQAKTVIEKTEVGDVEKTDNIHELFNMKDNLKKLTKVSASSLLRGAAPGSPESIDASSTAMTDLKDVATSNLNFMEQMQELHMNGNKEALGGLMKSVLRDHKGLQQFVKEANDINPDLALPDDLLLVNIPEGLDLESIPASVLADMYDPDMYDGMKEHARSLIPTLEDAGLALHNLKEHHRRLEDEDEYDEFDFGPDYPSSSSSGTRYARGRAGNFKDFGSKFQQGGFNPLNFQNHPMMKNMMRGVKARFPRHLKKHFEGGGGARRESRRQLLEEDDDCREPCDIEDRQCNCGRLRDCAIRMKPYDFTVLFAGGFIDEGGEFTIEPDEVQLFDAKGRMPEKIARIKGLAATEGECDELLQEFYTVCPRDQDTCNVVNDESFQLTVDQVCDAINTPTKLLVEEIAQAYDGFPNFAGGPFIDGTVDKEVIDWYTSQEVEEGGASGDWGSCNFRCQVGWLEAIVTEVFPDLRLPENKEEFENCTVSFEYCNGLMTTKLEQVKEEWSDLLEGSVASSDIGNVQPPGSTSYSGGIWTLQGAGTIGGKSDNFHYTYIPSSGEVDVIIHIQSFSSTSSDASAGLMIRDTLSADSRHFSVLLSNQRLQGFSRRSEGEVTKGWESSVVLQGSSGVWLKISKTAIDGSLYSLFTVDYSEVGESLETLRWKRLTQGGVIMANNFYVGMAIGAHENDVFRAKEFRVNTVLVEESVQCDSISYNVCGEFVDAFDQMYNGRDEEKFPLENPMRRDVTKPIHPSSGIEALRLASFPIKYQVSVTDQGIKQLIPGEYDYADISADFPGEVSPSTGAWTLKQDEHWLRCGRYTKKHCYHEKCCNAVLASCCYAVSTRLESKDEIHAIKCCSGTHDEAPWGKPDCPGCIPKPDTNCPYRMQMNSDKIPEVDRCKVGTFDEAVAFCSLHGGRLCSSDELEGNCAADEGCGFDNELVWSGYTYEYSAETGCLSSQNNLVLSREAMKACDDSIALLVGSSTSVGMIKGLAELLASKSEDDTDPMPGTCCLDTPSSSEYFGYDYDPDEEMECQNPGLFHLRVSSEACENAGGYWYRSPCHTLKTCIDDRPEVDDGHCIEDESIPCKDDKKCPVILKPGICETLALESRDIGNVPTPGMISFSNKVWAVTGYGTIGTVADFFHYAYLEASGDTDILVNIQSFNVTVGGSAGLMIRESLDEGSRHFSVLLQNEGNFQNEGNLECRYRETTDKPSDTIGPWPQIQEKFWVRITKVSNTFTASYKKGNTWTEFGSVDIPPFANGFYVGLATAARRENVNPFLMARELYVDNVLIEGDKTLEQVCISDQECPVNSVCGSVENIQTECLYDPGEFEKWAESITIKDAADQKQCEVAREELGFDRSELDDVLVCEQFDAYKCDPDSIFDEIDDITEGGGIIETVRSVTYVPPDFTDNPDLPFDKLPNKSNSYKLVDGKDVGVESFKKEVKDMKTLKIELYNTYTALGAMKDTNNWTLLFKCMVIDSATPSAFGVNPASAGCYFAAGVLKIVLYLLYFTSMISYRVTSDTYEKEYTFPTYYAMDGYKYSKYTFKNMEKFEKWAADSLHIMNDNMYGQHTKMRNQLQDTHNEMIEFMACSSTHLGIQLLENTCCYYEDKKRICTCEVEPPLSAKCCDILGLKGRDCPASDQRSLEENGSLVPPLTVKYLDGAKSAFENERAMMKELGDIEERDNQLQQSLHRIDLAVAAIEKKLGIGPDPKISKSKKSKKTKAVKPDSDAEVQEEGEEESSGFFNRKLLEAGAVGDEKAEDDNDEMKRSIVAMERKLGSIENKMTGIAMKGKVDKIEDKVDKIEDKVDKIEKSMEELKDMLSKLVMGGGAAAE